MDITVCYAVMRMVSAVFNRSYAFSLVDVSAFYAKVSRGEG